MYVTEKYIYNPMMKIKLIIPLPEAILITLIIGFKSCPRKVVQKLQHGSLGFEVMFLLHLPSLLSLTHFSNDCSVPISHWLYGKGIFCSLDTRLTILLGLTYL